ncbi:MAG: MBL fold metallo-hydrolase [Candidatus Magasanikbacteria bacterium]|nr:MBL fold metallo-hydrolase [Candidatus Magasanikbacteria bacterium]
MKLSFYGAAHEVTGSCYLLETNGKKILVDCGMFQGSDFNAGKNHDAFPFDPSSIDCVLVTHAHLDHTGRIPRLIHDGFKGKIYMTKATLELARIVWEDALNIMLSDREEFQLPVLYDMGDIETASEHGEGVSYGATVNVGQDISAVFKDAGHIFGSAFIEIFSEGKTIAFSGDIGNKDAPILRETEALGSIDILLCESTYGARNHESVEERDHLLLELIREGCKKGGTIMMPAFSIERTQEILYRLDRLSEEEKTLPKIPIFLDSPMAINALSVYKKYPEYYDEEACKKYMKGNDFFDFPQLKITATVDASKHINSVKGPKMVIAGAGMMNGGRILHHALRYLPDPHSTLIIVGYQAYGTLGRRLYEGADTVNIFGKKIKVACTIKAIGALSAHADQEKLLSWIASAGKRPGKVYCVHGEAESATAFAHKLRDVFGITALVPEYGETALV